MKSVLLFLLFWNGCQCAQWTNGPADGATEYACVGDDLDLPWSFSLDQGDTIQDIQWFDVDGQLAAMYTHDTFVAMPAYAQRVHFLPNAGVRFSHVTLGQSGNVSVQVVGHDAAGDLFTLRRTVQIHISDSLPTVDGTVHVSLSQVAIRDESSGEWTLEMRCGRFIFAGTPPFDVEWITPTGDVNPSKAYTNGQFLVNVPTPLVGGTYTCRVLHQMAQVCSPTDREASVVVDQNTARFSVLEAQLQATESKLTLLQAQNDHLRHQLDNNNISLTHRLDALQATEVATESKLALLQTESDLLQQELASTNVSLGHRLDALQASEVATESKLALLQSENGLLQQQLTSTNDSLSQQLDALQETQKTFEHATTTVQNNHQDQLTRHMSLLTALQNVSLSRWHEFQTGLSNLSHRVDAVHDIALRSVSFVASASEWTSSRPVTSLQALALHDVSTNRGSGYNAATGHFTAPYPGTYFFLVTITISATTHPTPAGHDLTPIATISLVQNDLAFAEASVLNNEWQQTIICHGVTHLAQGEEVHVYIPSGRIPNRQMEEAIFSGFLFAPEA